ILRSLSRSILGLLPRNTVVPIFRGPLKGSRWIMTSGVHTYWRGVYERGLTRQLESVVKPGMTCFDCGSNVGYFTLLMSRLVGPTGRVFSFEPLPENVDYVRKHVDMNKCANVTVIASALSDQNGKVAFSSDGSASH